ncbi:MAG: sulfate ABC transporter permease subunit CysT [Coprococcus phoceensis]
MKYTETNSEKKTTKTKSKKNAVIPGYHLSLGIVITMLSVIVLIPLASVLVYSLRISPVEFLGLILKENVRNAFFTSITSSFLAAVINVVFGLIVAWSLVKYEFPGKWLLDALIELPFALPTAVAGITLSKLYSTTGFFGKGLSKIGIHVAYTQTGIVVALVFVGLPFVIRAVQPILEKMDGQYEEAAFMLGASPRMTFFRVILPELKPALLTGFGLRICERNREYGSVIYISGNSAKNKTQVVSYVIMQKLSYIDYAGATAIALVMLIISFLLLLFVNVVQVRQSRRTNLL